MEQSAPSRQLLGLVNVAQGRPVPADITRYLVAELSGAAAVNMPSGVRDKVVADLRNGLRLSSFVPHPDIPDSEVTGAQSLVFNIDVTVNPNEFQVDGKPFDPNRIDRVLVLGGVDEWTLKSDFVSHPFHIHVNAFQVVKILDPAGKDVSAADAVDNAGDTVDPQYRALKGVWKDTLWVKNLAPPGQPPGQYTLVVRTRYQRYIGDFVLHCHILDHEDKGMMQNIRVALPDGAVRHQPRASPLTRPGQPAHCSQHRRIDMVTRRTALKAAVGVGAVTAFSGLVPGLKAFAAAPLRVRRNVNNMSLDDPDLATYRDFVGLMRGKSQAARVSWLGFANQHGDENNFKFCPHGDWYFLPWHRGFVEMYERAAAALTKNPKFAMPYWDWTTLRQLPAAFTDPTFKGKPNPLFVPGRGDNPSMVRNALTGPDALTDALVGPNVLRRIFKETVYEVFGTSRSVDRSNPANPKVQNNLDPKWVPMGGGNQGVMEATPHNNVHNNIGAFMPQSNSPRDPIFMMHHGNIDRIWAHWNALGRTNSTDPLWLNMPFTNNYIAPDGKFYTRVVKNLQSTDALGYTYDDLPKPDNRNIDLLRHQNLAALFNPAEKAKPTRLRQANTGAAKATAHLNLPFAMGAAVLQSVVAPPVANTAPREVVAIISEIKIGDNVRAIRVFVNRETVNQDVPDTDPHYVTTLSFLSHGKGGAHAQHKSLPSTIVDLTETLQNLSNAKRLSGDNITVQLLPVPAPGVPAAAVGDVVPASIEIAII